MLTCKRRKSSIYIYEGDKYLGSIYPAYSFDKMWCVDAPNCKTSFSIYIPFEEIFYGAFGCKVDSIPNIKSKMEKAWDLKQALLLANEISGLHGV